MQSFFFGIMLVLFSALSYAEEFISPETFRLGYYAPAFPDHAYDELEIAVKVIGEEIGKNIGDCDLYYRV